MNTLNPTSKAALQEQHMIQYLSRAFHHGSFLDIQHTLETITLYHDPKTTFYTFTQRLTRITGPLTQPLLRAHATHFTPWALARIQTCFECLTELTQDDVEIIIPILGYETNQYGSTLLDRFLAVLRGGLWLTSSFTVWAANRAWDAPDSLLNRGQKGQLIGDVAKALGAIFLRDARFDGRLEFSGVEQPLPLPPARSIGLVPRPIPKLHGSDLALFSTHLFDLNMHNAFRGIMWRLDWTIPLSPFSDFISIHVPFLQRLLPILPAHGIPYDDFVLQHFCNSALFALVHQGVGSEPDRKRVGREWDEWENRRRTAAQAMKGLDQGVLKMILGPQYVEIVGMEGIKRAGNGGGKADRDFVSR
ncbi:hypothetical protein P280DRAFT_37838 [Massarina eburnea CBS 473.64]|uniref:Uncharacterized protein n=1 Tax=Massarina eburnea CBS 473.64 TaxID=1395130 RepID=A0A6A6RV43_9PLEO|nr:hypothetical protein P280DRAFT_37838 [Massarina eburnea CBS 473.64]